MTRAAITAGVAGAAWSHHNGGLWWRHAHGGYGWVGPVFWPFAYYDINDYAMWGSGYGGSFWNYGYDDIYAGIFAPYGYNDLVGYRPQTASRYSSRRDSASRAGSERHMLRFANHLAMTSIAFHGFGAGGTTGTRPERHLRSSSRPNGRARARSSDCTH